MKNLNLDKIILFKIMSGLFGKATAEDSPNAFQPGASPGFASADFFGIQRGKKKFVARNFRGR